MPNVLAYRSSPRARWRGRLTRPWGETTARLVSDEFGQSLYSASDETMRRLHRILLKWRKNSVPTAPSGAGLAAEQARRRCANRRSSRQEQLDELLGAVDLTLTPEQVESWRRRTAASGCGF
ncbi:hypothetical protein DMH17_04810 [Raoultella planticola]|nr:hypothetical protein [Raoultella planticola]